MPKKDNKSTARREDESDELSALNKMAHLLEILTRLNLQTLKADRSQAEMISMLDSLGCGRSEIARLLGTTSNTVGVALHNLKKRNKRK
jgi:DNA-directed RNA polymerase specialized sigma24 family protein